MKETTLYICEICNTRYSSKKEAEICEAAHIKPKRLTKSMRFHPYKCGREPFTYKPVNYPDWIDVEMADGNTIRYKR